MNLEDLKKAINENASKSFLKLNPDLGGLSPQGPKLHCGSQEQDFKLEASARSVEVRIELTAYRRKLLDEHENHPYSFKHLVDIIADYFGVPDNDPRLTWRFYQLKTDGREGCTVRIEVAHG